jgi:hypothetical protein
VQGTDNKNLNLQNNPGNGDSDLFLFSKRVVIPSKQGDHIGRIFAYWAISTNNYQLLPIHLGIFLKIAEVAHSWAIFVTNSSGHLARKQPRGQAQK